MQKSKFYVDVMSLHQEVTGSCHLCVLKLPDGSTIKFIVDCGLFQEDGYRELNDSFPFNASELDFVLVTHNHIDHTGRLPMLVAKGYQGTIYCTDLTSVLLPQALTDSCKILGQVAKRQHKNPIFNSGHLAKTFDLIQGFPFNTETQINEYVKVTFLENGHLFGAAMILVQISYPGYDDINMLFTGDYDSQNTFFDVGDVPEHVKKLPLTIIQESTYGYMNTSDIRVCFEDNFLQALNKGGTIVIPVFSLGRSQEILFKLKQFQDSGKLDPNIPIYLDGKLTIRYTTILCANSSNFKEGAKEFLPQNLCYVSKPLRESIINDHDVKIIVTSSGMGTYGPAPLYISSFIDIPKSLVHFVGYAAEGTVARKLSDAEEASTVTIGGVIKSKKAEIKHTNEFSAHAKADTMIEFLNKFENIKLILVNHGTFESKDIFAKEIVKSVKAKDVAVESRDFLYRVSPYGLIKSLPTKFL